MLIILGKMEAPFSKFNEYWMKNQFCEALRSGIVKYHYVEVTLRNYDVGYHALLKSLSYASYLCLMFSLILECTSLKMLIEILFTKLCNNFLFFRKYTYLNILLNYTLHQIVIMCIKS